MFYADKQSHWWLNERLVDWLAVIYLPIFCILFFRNLYQKILNNGNNYLLIAHSCFFHGRNMIASSQAPNQLSIQNLFIFVTNSITHRFSTVCSIIFHSMFIFVTNVFALVL